MEFIKKYENMTTGDKEQDGIIHCASSLPCLICGKPTAFVEICSEGRFCSDKCLKEFYNKMKG